MDYMFNNFSSIHMAYLIWDNIHKLKRLQDNCQTRHQAHVYTTTLLCELYELWGLAQQQSALTHLVDEKELKENKTTEVLNLSYSVMIQLAHY